MASYTRDEARSASIEYFDGDEMAADVVIEKYLLRDNNDDDVFWETSPDDIHRRSAKEFARVEGKYRNPMSFETIYDYLSDVDPETGKRSFGRIVAQGSPMAGIGNEQQLVSLSNCFVIDGPVDSYGGILQTDQEQAHLMKRRGGVGFDISGIRPKGLGTSNAARTTDGIGIFMTRFSNTCREVAQKGRRGALMMTCDVHHPEIETFINIKKDKGKVTGANLSIRVSDEFMRAVITNGEYEQRFPVEPGLPEDSYLVKKQVKAWPVWNSMMVAAHESAEPGVLFWDTVLRESPSEWYRDAGFATVSTNPCGEIVLSAYDSCRLMVVNVAKFVRDPFGQASFDWAGYRETARVAQRLMDDMIDLELEKIDAIINKITNIDPESDNVKRIELELWKKIRESAVAGRRTGLGITGLGDAMAGMGIRYGSEASVEFTDRVYENLSLGAYEASVAMAKERGAFGVWEGENELQHPFLRRIYEKLSPDVQADWTKWGRRNIACTTTAPTGSVSVCTQTTSGIEPAYMLYYVRRRKLSDSDIDAGISVDFVDASGDKWHEYPVFHHWYKLWLKKTGRIVGTEIDSQLLAIAKESIEASPYWKATSIDVDWEASVDVQATAQRHICHAISKTCVSENTLVETDRGLFYPNEIANPDVGSSSEVSETYMTRNADGREAMIGFVMNQGEKLTFTLKTKEGYALRATGDHRVLRLNPVTDLMEWTEIFDLEIGDRIKLA